MSPVILPWRRALPPTEPPLDLLPRATPPDTQAWDHEPGLLPGPYRPAVLTRRCGPCEVTWRGTADSKCWNCGGPAADY